jgi:malonyl-CoA O-methyltransferase
MKWWAQKKQVPVLSPIDGYDLWASSYSQENNPIKNLSDAFIEKSLPNLSNQAVLDAGCGTGKFCSMAERQQAKKIVGLDLSQVMINTAKENCAHTELICADLTKTQFESDYFDVVICALVLGHIQNLADGLDTLLKAVKKNGIIIITDFHPFLTMNQSKRTFKNSSGKEFEIIHHLHLFQHYFSSFNKYGFVVLNFEEPLYRNTPVVFGLCAKKS